MPQAPDDAARAWLADALEVVAAFRAIGSIQGQVGSLQGEIGSIQGEVGSLQGQIGSVQGQQGSLQGKIGSIQGEQGSLQGAIGSHQGAIGSLQGALAGRPATPSRRGSTARSRRTRPRSGSWKPRSAAATLSRRIAEAEAELRAFEQAAPGRDRRARAARSKDVQAEERIQAARKADRGPPCRGPHPGDRAPDEAGARTAEEPDRLNRRDRPSVRRCTRASNAAARRSGCWRR